jgi:hypothetical protein
MDFGASGAEPVYSVSVELVSFTLDCVFCRSERRRNIPHQRRSVGLGPVLGSLSI